MGATDVTMVDRWGALYDGIEEDQGITLDRIQKGLSVKTNLNKNKGTLADVVKGADVLIISSS